MSDYYQATFAVLKQLIEPLRHVLACDSEVVLHDLTMLPNSIVAIEGSLTGRQVGGPATDLLLSKYAAGTLASQVGYQSRLPDGRLLRSTTIIVHAPDDEPVAALCLNSDVTAWQRIEAVASLMLGHSTPTPTFPTPNESFFHDLDDAADQFLARSIKKVGVPVNLMRKQHKVEVVKNLKELGFFSLREAAERAAQEMGVSRFSIYNYLNEIDEGDQSTG